jgi:3-deoxy-7-phosphoheptulonate synthase
VPVVKVGRIAGQFAKPRSSPTEKRGDVELPSYRGDIINDVAFTPEARTPDPRRMLEAYRQSAATLNLLRAFATGGYANVERASLDARLRQGQPAVRALRGAGRSHHRGAGVHARLRARCPTNPEMRTTDFYTSHEALLLGYEQAMTRIDSTSGDWYDTSGHMIWIGDRTRQPDHAHVEYCRGVKNPIGLKCGPTLKPDGMLR